MPHYTAAIRFEDGLMLYAEYDGVGDVMIPMLWSTLDELSDNWRSGQWTEHNKACHQDEPIVIVIDMHDYAWEGRACRRCMCLSEGNFEYDDRLPLPEWYPFKEPNE